MSTRMSSESEYIAGLARCHSKRFLKPWVWARESQLPISASITGQRGWLNLRFLMVSATRVPTESQREQRHEETGRR